MQLIYRCGYKMEVAIFTHNLHQPSLTAHNFVVLPHKPAFKHFKT